MQEFLIAIHRDLTGQNPKPSPDQMKEALKPYQEWIAGIAASNQLAAPVKRWDVDGRFITNEAVQQGPYTEKQKSIGGLFLIKAKDYEEAVSIASACPIIKYGAIVEVRMAIVAA
jgi:hypothetical protein